MDPIQELLEFVNKLIREDTKSLTSLSDVFDRNSEYYKTNKLILVGQLYSLKKIQSKIRKILDNLNDEVAV